MLLTTVLLLLPAGAARAEWTAPCIDGAAAPICHFWRGKLKFVDDGDTIDVKLPTSTGKVKTVRVRITGIQAMEQTVYNSHPGRRRGECHALPATARLERLLRTGRGVVRLSAQDPASETGGRLRRSVATRIRGKWVDVGKVLVAEGHALWHPNWFEYAWNATYSKLSQQAALAQVNLFDTDACGSGPSAGAPVSLSVNWDAPGDDAKNVNGEYVTIQNLDPARSVRLNGWWVRDSALRRFDFPSDSQIAPSGSVVVYVGRGTNTATTLYWGLKRPAFENVRPDRGIGDGAYLFDPQGDLRAWMIYPCHLYDCIQ